MRRQLAALAALFCSLPAFAQPAATTYTAPAIPSTRDLERLHLTMAWRTFLPIDDRADGIATVQHIDDEVYVQTRSNMLVVLKSSNGEEVWRMEMPKRRLPVFPVAVNHNLVCVVNGPRLYLLDRSNGKLKHYVELPSTVTAGLAADIQQCFIVLSSHRVIAVGLQAEDLRRGFRVREKPEQPSPPTGIKLETQAPSDMATQQNRSPSVNTLQSFRPPYTTSGRDVSPSFALAPTMRDPYKIVTGNRAPSLAMLRDLGRLAELSEINSEDKPRILWELQANRRMEEAPLMYNNFLILAGADRSVFVCDKHAMGVNLIRHEYLADAHLTAPVGQYGSDLYFATSDGEVVWVNVESFRNSEVPVRHLKRYMTVSPIDRPIVTTDDSVYLAGARAGVSRLSRGKFEKVWTNLDADRVLAVNPNFVYAADRRGNLLVLDKARGLKMASLDIRGFDVPVVNNRDDRLYLTAHNGLLVCLHDRSFRRADLLRKKEPKLDYNPEDDWKKEPEVKKDVEPKKKDEEPKKKDEESKKEADQKKE